jgi:DNA-binding transcriptional LysR family regulator
MQYDIKVEAMDVKLLEAFRKVVECRSVTEAANILGVTQPAVSAQLSRLEELVGFALFDRQRGRLRTTKQGQSFYDEVAKALGSIEHLEQSAINIKSGSLGRLTIVSHPSAAISLLPDLVTEFRNQRPSVFIRLITRNSDVVRDLFPSAVHDIGIAELPIDGNGIKLAQYNLRCVAVLPKNHALAEQDVITPQDLSGVPFFAASKERSLHHELAKAFATAGADWNVIGDAEVFSSICAIVAGGSAVSVLDPWTVHNFRDRVAIRPFEPSIPYEIGIFHSADHEPSLLAKEFMSLLQDRLRIEDGSKKRWKQKQRN